LSKDATIYHNPACGTSRNVLAALREAGREPTVVEYLKAGWTQKQLGDLFAKMGVSAKDVLRVRGTPAEGLGLTKPGVTEAQIVKAMTEHPILVERPIVVTGKGAALCRPAERLQALL
jgi:arsenate reductase